MNDNNDDNNVDDDDDGDDGDDDDDDDEALPGLVPCHPSEFSNVSCQCLKMLVTVLLSAVTVSIWPREVVSCLDFILGAVQSQGKAPWGRGWALSLLFGPCRLSEFTLAGPQ